MRLTLLSNTAAPYRVPQWNALGELCDFQVVVLRKQASMRNWKIDQDDIRVPVLSVENRQLILKRMELRVNLSYWAAARLVAQTNPDVVVIGGWDSPAYWAVLGWARRHRVPAVLWCETNGLSSRTAGRWAIDRLRRYFVGSCKAFYVPSEFTVRYLENLGADRENIVLGRNSCDVAKFPSCERIGGGGPVLLFVGQLIERKGVRQMMRALELLDNIPWRLRIAGTGPLEAAVREWAADLKRSAKVEFLGYVQQAEMSRVFRGADILLFPSILDPYPLVIVEALFNGLYIIGSDRCAVSHDMLQSGVTGDIISPDDSEKFASAVRAALGRVPFDRRRIRASVEDVTPEREAANLLRAAHIASGRLHSNGDVSAKQSYGLVRK